jgi:ketosteroid isomerase-like protein
MKSLILAFFLFTSIQTFAQSEKEVETAVQNLRTAMLAEDATTLKSLTSENLTYGHSGGVIENQEEFVAVFESKKSDYQKWDVSDQTISMNGKDLAIVRQNVKAEIVSIANSTTNKLDLGLLMVWVKEKGEWKLLARQAFRHPQN